ncbi:hypothetical protein [Fodinibius saliphilus]|uniref:hypothetical protein n=1 Tax=Fodinibius saliphilus TaxID=1920650 RepID=UPI001109D041|nr:hypothetical protein [Fodinibius saliphilus]
MKNKKGAETGRRREATGTLLKRNGEDCEAEKHPPLSSADAEFIIPASKGEESGSLITSVTINTGINNATATCSLSLLLITFYLLIQN